MFQSARLNYRELTENDFELFYDLYSNKEVMKYAYLDRICSREDAIEAFGNILADQKDNEKGTQYVVSLRELNIMIGIVDYFVILNHEKGGIYEIGYFIKPDYWGKGFGTEMGKALIDYLFTNFNIHKVTASCNFQNKNSEGIMIKLGMTKEGISKKARYKDNQWDDEMKYALLKEEWIANTRE